MVGSAAPDECKRTFRHIAPPIIDDERMTPARDKLKLSHRGVALLELVLCRDDDLRDHVVRTTCDQQQGPAKRLMHV